MYEYIIEIAYLDVVEFVMAELILYDLLNLTIYVDQQ